MNDIFVYHFNDSLVGINGPWAQCHRQKVLKDGLNTVGFGLVMGFVDYKNIDVYHQTYTVLQVQSWFIW